ncbi:putative Thiosulfate sulfurtransferase [Hypsibius exemplaris]|uniref:Thiosulfate sulfurtransferase n=1 Tax=Hypsibius exemplaris TaxID=2072580 RepID=A0A1W0W9K1_HYPEX|nr:putative Thiosulfate sulfurtransferase [Hypsibius exemplaris]
MAEKGTIEPLVSVAWLKEQLEQKRPELVVLDCSYDANKDVRKEYGAAHIPGAVFFNFKECRDVTSPYPNMIPPPQVFAQYCGSIGLDNTMHVVLYDNNSRGLFSAPRAYWMFKAFGHDKNGFPTSSDIVQRPTKIFHATMKKEYLKTYDDVVHVVNGGGVEAQLIDARPPVLFQGGHITKARNIPYFSVLNDLPNATLKDEAALRQTFAAAGIDLDRPAIFNCSSGMSACVLFFAASILGKKPPEITVYNGSWTEWEPRAKGHHGLVEYTTP